MSSYCPTRCTPEGVIAFIPGGRGDLTFAVKDTLDVAGQPTQAGSPLFADAAPATRHARLVSQLIDAGCRLMAKTTLHELAFGVTGVNSWQGTPVNPRYPELIPGGSSSGSATVVAAGQVDFSVGTDTGGSVRLPAACCGLFGLKPTFGRLSRDGVMPAHSSLDCPGFFTRDIDTLEQLAQRLGWQPLPVTWPATPLWLENLAAAPLNTALEQWLAVRLPGLPRGELPLLEAAHDAGVAVIGHENAAAFSALRDHPALSADVKARLAAGAAITAQQLAGAEEIRQRFRHAVDALLSRHGFLILPAVAEPIPTLAQAADPLRALALNRLLRPFNLSGHPALVVPAGEWQGRPLGLQIIGQPGNEMGLIHCAAALFRR